MAPRSTDMPCRRVELSRIGWIESTRCLDGVRFGWVGSEAKAAQDTNHMSIGLNIHAGVVVGIQSYLTE